MSQSVEQVKKESVKQIAFTEGRKFRLNTEAVTTNRFQFVPEEGIIVNTSGLIQYHVLEINAFSVKVRVMVLGQIEAVWCRFETFIFDTV
jgi:hypothetical protein